MKGDGLLIAGGGLAAQRCCETLRARGFDRPIRVICEEPRTPYDRPPLSKAVLYGERDPATLAFRPLTWYAERGIALLTSERARSLDLAAATLELASGSRLRYEQLVIATGSRPRTLPGLRGFRNAHTLRTVSDAIALRDELSIGGRLVVIGAGFVGLEVAATARRLGVDVTVIEAAREPLTRALGTELGQWFAELHRAEGVEVLTDTHVSRFGTGAGKIQWVEIPDGRRIECSSVLVGIGIEPDTLWLDGSGLDPDGVRVDDRGRTSAANVYAAGDACRPLDPATGEYRRTEHWEAAARQGAQVARTILDDDPVPFALSSFWTDQYGLRIQTVGDATGAERVEFDGEPSSRDFSVLMFRGRRPVAAMTVGRPRELPRLRHLIEASAREWKGAPDEIRAAS
jgi:3-phenylpropionate/trans-cinnamate dioxygenase ferredoxin reductase component